MYKYFFLISFLLYNICFPQYQYPVAPEIWSTPEPVVSISELNCYYPSISWDGNKLYFTGAYYIEKTDTGWSEYKTIPSIDKNLVIAPCISPNGKRLFFTWFIDWQGWDLFYIDWDSLKNDWGTIHNAGPGINKQEYAERGATMPNDTTIIFLRGYNAFISHYDKQKKEWKEAHQFSKIQEYEFYCFGSDWGIYVSPDLKKVYTVSAVGDTTIDGKYYFNYLIKVSYADSNELYCGFGFPKILNICMQSDTFYFKGKYKERWEGCPSLTPDGKTIYFAADYYGKRMIFKSHMLIDENGNPTTSVIDTPNKIIPNNIELYPPYPNPFNTATVISYQLPISCVVTLKIYDILGREVETLVNEEKKTGSYTIKFDANNLSSGIYFYQLMTKDQVITKKMILMK
jgi:hypothetical protein